jgi:protein PET117
MTACLFEKKKMSRAAKITFSTGLVLTTGTIVGVHYMQRKERQAMRLGVEREHERLQKKQDNLVELERQQQLRVAYENKQPISRK